MGKHGSISTYAATQLPNATAPGSIPLVITFCCITAFTILGNTLVISAVLLVHKLRSPSNFLIVSLAASDLLVSIMVMPFSTYMEYRGYWGLGEIVCDIFTVFDVLLCTASILNLCAISIDRYLAVTRPFDYVYKRTPKRMFIMIVIAWVLSALISIPPTFGFKDKFVPGKCEYSKNFIYQVYATLGAFYIPLIVMLILYGRIVILARRIVKSDRARLASTTGDDKRNSIQTYAESQDTDDGTAYVQDHRFCDCFGKVCCFALRKRGSVDSNKSSMDVKPFENCNNKPHSHSLPTSNTTPPTTTTSNTTISGRAGSQYPSQIHHFSRLPPGAALSISPLPEEPPPGRERVGFLTPVHEKPPGLFTKHQQHRTGGHLRGRSPQLRDRAFSINVANLQTKSTRQSLPIFSKQRFSLVLHLKKTGIKRSSEAKAIRTLGVIMGVFCVCWLPFFIVALGRPLYNFIHKTEVDINPRLNSFFLWLGYVNSALNPVIYAIFNREFRRPFWELLNCHCLDVNARLRERRYQHEYHMPQVSLPPVSGGSVSGETPCMTRSRQTSNLLDRRRSSLVSQ